MSKHLVWGIGLGLLLALPGWVRADEEWGDQRKDRLEDAVRELEEARARGEARAVPTDPAVALRHGNVRLGADLARVDVVLEVQNPGTQPVQWQRAFEIDPIAEVIGASLERGEGEAIEARTLALESARRIYGEVTMPRQRTPTRPWPRMPNTDPLRVERPDGARLEVTVWPIAPGETVKVHLDFVTPLRGREGRRAYRDVIEADLGGVNGRPSRAAVATAPDQLPTPALSLALETDWLVHAGTWRVAGDPVGMVRAGGAGDVLRFVAASGERRDRVPTLPLATPHPEGDVVAVPGGGLLTRVAVWHFDPTRFLAEHDLHVPRNATLRLLKHGGSTSRIAPWTFEAAGDPMPVTARLSPRAETLRYAVEVRLPNGRVVDVIDVERPVQRVRLDAELEGAITGWHRAQLVQRVLTWAGDEAGRQARALEYAVDVGVLVPGTAALAVPDGELRRVPRRSRTEFRRDGVPLGAQDGEGDYAAPPHGALRED